MVAIIDYGMGNLLSDQKALNFIKEESIITSDKIKIQKSSSILLPGVGSFRQGMINLKELGLIEVLNDQVINKKKPFLGICLGMQLIMEKGFEPIESNGLGWIKGQVKEIINKSLAVPHLGWNRIYSPLNENKKDDLKDNYYFIHSYHVIPDENVVKSMVNYEFPMVASIRKDNIYSIHF